MLCVLKVNPKPSTGSPIEYGKGTGFRQQQTELAKAQRQIRQQPSLLGAQTAAMRSLMAEVREAHETVRKVKARVAAAQPALVAAR